MRLTRSFQAEFKPAPPYSCELTLNKPAGWDLFTPFEKFSDGKLRTAALIDKALTGFVISCRGNVESPEIIVTVYTENEPGKPFRDKIGKFLSSRLSVNEDLKGFYSMAEKDPILRHTVDALYGMHSTAPSHIFTEVVLALSLHMAPLRRSEEMMRCFIREYGETAEFDGQKILAWPDAERISRVSENDLRKRCKFGFRAPYVINSAAIISSGFPSYEELESMPPEEARARLLELPGIGDYSVDIVSPNGGFPIDAWSVDVFGELFYGKRPRDRRKSIDKIKAEGLKRWGDYAWMAFFYIVQDLEGLSEKIGISLRLT